jgi:hypothetical protein
MTLVVKKYREAGERAEELAQCSLDSPFFKTVVFIRNCGLCIGVGKLCTKITPRVSHLLITSAFA